jgi:hypothetical protein
MANAEVAQRLLAECDAFEAGRIQIAALQVALLAHGQALEAMPRPWHVQVDRWEGTLELARFTQSESAQAETARQVISEVRQALGEIASVTTGGA